MGKVGGYSSLGAQRPDFNLPLLFFEEAGLYYFASDGCYRKESVVSRVGQRFGEVLPCVPVTASRPQRPKASPGLYWYLHSGVSEQYTWPAGLPALQGKTAKQEQGNDGGFWGKQSLIGKRSPEIFKC